MEFITTPKQYIDAVQDAAASVGKSVTFRGTVHRVRDMSDFAFVVIRVNRGLIQCSVFRRNRRYDQVRHQGRHGCRGFRHRS